MPPKKKPPEPSKKTDAKKKEKIVEDKTFGLKNKKGAKTQKFIQQVNKAYAGSQKKQEPKTSKKEEKRKELDDLNQIFRPVATQKIDKGVDPKSVLCAFFKQGQCTKGDKCKFSHNLAVERKSEKINIYCDMRDENDNMDNWDDEKLKEVIEKKHGELERKMPKTDIICKHFIDALETSKYGWFWECPNGGDKCHYRHALPSGFVLNKDKKKEKKEEISIEDLVEREREKLDPNLPKINLESFLAWKKKKIADKKAEKARRSERQKAEFNAGRHVGLSGREMFTFNPDLVAEGLYDEGEVAFESKDRENEEDDVKYKEIDFESLSIDVKDVDGTGTQASQRRNLNNENTKFENKDKPLTIDSVPIDENLFSIDNEDLEELEEGLDSLNVN